MNIIEFNKITKTFEEGKMVANNKITFNVKKGDIHAIIGENGAGKTTLLSILFGILKQDSGNIKLMGKNINFQSALDARKHNLGMVYQHFQLIDSFSILDNIILGKEKTKFGFVQKNEVSKKIKKLCKRYDFNFDIKRKIKSLTIGQKQKVEILKVLYTDAKILILDEPTAMLSPGEIKELMVTIKTLKAQGKTILFVSHKLDEVKKIANVGTVIRHGKVIKTFNISSLEIKEIANLMVGRTLISKMDDFKKPVQNSGKILKLQNLTTKKVYGKNIENITFDVSHGEIVAVVGVEGNGQVPLIENLSGLRQKITSGTIELKKQIINKFSISRRYKLGMSHVPEDRHKYAMFLSLPSFESITMRSFFDKPFTSKKFIKIDEMKKYAKKIINKYDVRGTNQGMVIGSSLSGGNQQKLVVGREFEKNADLLLIFQPTRGVDIGATEFIHKEIIQQRNQGHGILLVTYDLDEAMQLADKFVVMNKGKISAIIKNEKTSKEHLGVHMVSLEGEKNVLI